MSPCTVVFVAAAVALLAVPAILLRPGPPPDTMAQATPLDLPPAPPPLRAAFARPLFAASSVGQESTPADAPALLGVVGRLGTDAVALVRDSQGASRTLSPGQAIDGWRLESLAIDAAYFTRGAQRARVPMPAGDGD